MERPLVQTDGFFVVTDMFRTDALGALLRQTRQS